MPRSTRLVFRVFCTSLFAAALLPIAHAQVSMMLRNINSPAGGGSAINRGDFNRDGILDVVTANSSSIGGISVYSRAPMVPSTRPSTLPLRQHHLHEKGDLWLTLILTVRKKPHFYDLLYRLTAVRRIEERDRERFSRPPNESNS